MSSESRTTALKTLADNEYGPLGTNTVRIANKVVDGTTYDTSILNCVTYISWLTSSTVNDTTKIIFTSFCIKLLTRKLNDVALA